MHVKETIEIKRSPQEVFNYVADVHNYPAWMAHVLEVRTDTSPPRQQSERFTVAIKSVGRRFVTPYERTSDEAHRRYTDRAVGGPIPNQRWHSDFQEVPGGTRVSLTQDNNSNEDAREHSEENWAKVMGDMKKIVEKKSVSVI